MSEKKKRERTPRNAHVVMAGKGMRCLRCGTEEELPFNQGGVSFMESDGNGGYRKSWRPVHGLDIRVMDAYGKAFTSRHTGCKKDDPRGEARYQYDTPEEWIGSWDTGTSSLAIYGAFKGKPLVGLAGGLPFGEPIPYDPADFGRCYRLLEVAPDAWREQLGRVAEVHPCWALYVDEWAELEKLWKEEEPTGECPKLYERLKQLVPV